MFPHLISGPVTSFSVWDYKHLAGHLLSSCYDKLTAAERTAGKQREKFCDGISQSPNVMLRHCNYTHHLMPFWCGYVIKKGNPRGLHGLICRTSLLSQTPSSAISTSPSTKVSDVVSGWQWWNVGVKCWKWEICKIKCFERTNEMLLLKCLDRKHLQIKTGCWILSKTSDTYGLAKDQTPN